jgi:hypothetical protein
MDDPTPGKALVADDDRRCGGPPLTGAYQLAVVRTGPNRRR